MMTVYHLSPWRRKSGVATDDSEIQSLRTVRCDIDSVFDNFFSHLNWAPTLQDLNTNSFLSPSLDITETDKEYHISMELPGVDEKEVDISFSNGLLTVKGEKKAEEKKEGKNYHRVERSYGMFQRSVSLPEGINPDAINATFTHGVLNINIPKPEEKKPEVKKINIKKD